MKKEMTLFLLILFILIFISSCEKLEGSLILSPTYEGKLVFISSFEELEESSGLSPAYEEECGEIIPGIINVKFKEGYGISTPKSTQDFVIDISSRGEKVITPQKIDKLFFESEKGTKNRELQEKIGLNRWVKLTIPLDADLQKELAKWSSKPEIEKVELEYTPCLIGTPSEGSYYRTQWYHNNTGYNLNGVNSTPDADIDSTEAWDIQTGAGITVAVPDTSVFWHHEDLIDNVWQNLGEDADGDGKTIQPNGTEYIYYTLLNGSIANRSYIKYIFDPDDINGIDNDDWDGNPSTYVDDFIGWDFLGNDSDPNYDTTQDSSTYQWHGTSTMGSLAATGNNSIGVTGTCWNCKVIAMRRGVGNSYALQYAIENGAKVISMSWLSSYTGAIGDALEYAHELGIVLLAGAGNFAPSGSYNSLCFNENIICITGSTMYDTSWGPSSYPIEKGATIDLASPSSVVFGTFTYNHPLNIYGSAEGTSLGTPIAAGVAALILSENPDLTPDEVKSIMQSSTDKLVSVTSGSYIGTGRLNAAKALNLTLSSKKYGGFPVSLISPYNSVYNIGGISISGTANSSNFSKYEVYYSAGHYSENWVFLEEYSTPIEKDILYTMDFFEFPLGEGQIKIVVYDTNNQSAYDTFPYIIDSYPEAINQSFNLSKGWNTFSPTIESVLSSSSNINSFLVADYNKSGWQIDFNFQNGDEFTLEPWQGYLIYSEENKSITLKGYAPINPLPALDWTSWSLVSFDRTDSFANIFFSDPGLQIFNITIQNNSFLYQPMTDRDILTKGKLYWVAFTPKESPPKLG